METERQHRRQSLRPLVSGKSTVPDPRDEQHREFCLDPISSQSVFGPSELRPNEFVVHTRPPLDQLNHAAPPVSSPYSFSCKRVPKDAEDQLEAASGAASATARVHAVPYSVGSLCSQLYRYESPIPHHVEAFHRIDSLRSSSAPGNAVDWMYQRRGIKYSYTVHLRDTGTVSLNARCCTPHSPL